MSYFCLSREGKWFSVTYFRTNRFLLTQDTRVFIQKPAKKPPNHHYLKWGFGRGKGDLGMLLNNWSLLGNNEWIFSHGFHINRPFLWNAEMETHYMTDSSYKADIPVNTPHFGNRLTSNYWLISAVDLPSISIARPIMSSGLFSNDGWITWVPKGMNFGNKMSHQTGIINYCFALCAERLTGYYVLVRQEWSFIFRIKQRWSQLVE